MLNPLVELDKTSAPVDELVDAVVPPMKRDFVMPIPPAVMNDPVEGDVESVALEMLIAVPTIKVLAMATPPATVRPPPFDELTASVVAPIPTPPLTFNVPFVAAVEIVVSVRLSDVPKVADEGRTQLSTQSVVAPEATPSI